MLSPCGSSNTADVSSSDGSVGGGGGRAVAFHPLRKDTIAAAKPNTETQI